MKSMLTLTKYTLFKADEAEEAIEPAPPPKES